MKGYLREIYPRQWLCIFFLLLSGLVLALYSSFEYVHVTQFPLNGEAACNFTETLNCESAISSPYSSLFGFSLGSLGALFYGLSLLFFLFYAAEAEELPRKGLSGFFFATTASLGASCVLFVISLLTLEAWCPVCLALYVVSILLWLVIWRMESESGILRRLRVGVLTLVSFVRAPTGLPKMLAGLLGTSGDRVRSVGIVGVTIASVVILLFSDLWFSLLLGAFYRPSGDLQSLYDEWKREEIQQIPFQEEDIYQRDYRKGAGDASIRIVEFFDYECPACRTFYFDLKDLLDEFGKQIAVEYRNYPLDNSCNSNITSAGHEYACDAAELARCAGEQEQFFEAHEYILTLEAFDTRDPHADKGHALRAMISELDLDRDLMIDCLSSNRQMRAIQRDIEIADQLELRGTPSVWVNGRRVNRLRELRELVQYLIARGER
ncbi:MAG: vitamin K epoxide reductase family protein [Bdellovibrionota bacterium]|jgi:uncharacterized membrane protein/predicted DsbA family dithiol-disulfide isomerase